MRPTILYEDGEALVIDKPAGLPMDRPRRGGPSLADSLSDLRLGFQRRPAPVHRLDTDTSGCLLLARNAKALARFAQSFEARLVEKVYLGILTGIPREDSGSIDLALAKVSSAEQGWRMVPDSAGKPSLTHWRVMARAGGRALMEFRPETGRTHQLRVHAASGIGLPLLGDPLYGTGEPAARMMLHAASLIVTRPGKTPITAHAPLPAPFHALGFGDG